MGDLNVNMSAGDTGLSNLLKVYGLTNVVKNPTCYKAEMGKTTVQKRLQSICVKDIIWTQCSAYQSDLEAVPFHVGEVLFDSVDGSHWLCNELLKAGIERHAPVKKTRH